MKHKSHRTDYSTAREEEVRVWKHRLSIDSLPCVGGLERLGLERKHSLNVNDVSPM